MSATPPPDPLSIVVSNALPPGESALMGLYDLEGAGLAFRKHEFHQEELVDIMISHVRSADPKVAQKGITQLLGFTKDIATLHGKIGKAKIQKETSDEHGNKTISTLSRTGITDRLSSTRPVPTIPAGKEFIPAQIGVSGKEPPSSDRKNPPPVAS